MYTFVDAKGKGQGQEVTLYENAYSAISPFIIRSFSNLAGR